MIDTNSKTIYFGHGDILIVSGTGSIITFYEIKDNLEPGQKLNPEQAETYLEPSTKYIGMWFKNLDELMEFKRQLTELDQNASTSFEYKGYTFDFSTYNKASIEALYTHIDKARLHFICLMAI